MTTKAIKQVLAGNGYLGRGILLGKAPDDAHALIAYFIMGRSENSHNRAFTREGDGPCTQALDPSKLFDPLLIIYAPVRMIGTEVIVINGDRTDMMHDFLCHGETLGGVLRDRTLEPDKPNSASRASGWMNASTDFAYRLSTLRSAGGNPSPAQRMFFEYETSVPGQGHLIHTYRCDGNPIPSFEGEPVYVSVPRELEKFTQLVWNSLNTENRVSLFIRRTRLSDGETETRVTNKNQ